MTSFFSPLLAAALMAQFQGGTLQGTVVDDQGKPVGGAQVVLFAPPPRDGNVDPLEVSTESDAQGRFELTTPAFGRDYLARARIWAYRAPSAIAARGSRPSPSLVLRKPEPRTIKVEGPDGRPAAGARVSPRVVDFPAWGASHVPDLWVVPLAVTTGIDGKAYLNYLGSGDKLVAVRVEAESVGAQDFQLLEQPRREAQGATITIRLKPTGRLAGRVRTRAGEPVAGNIVEVWSKGSSLLAPRSVEFKTGPLRTAADGSFQTPDNLLVGSTYRVAVRAPGKEPILSDWITIGEQPRVLLPMLQKPLRTINGRVVDRRGKPVAGVEVFQSGDGPERTATKTDEVGRFSLDGFSQGPVFLFVRGEGFRFFGRLIKAGDGDVTVELTRTNERPTHEMRMLPDAVPLEESRALARRLIAPYWEAIDNNNVADRALALRPLVMTDPDRVLRKLEELELPDGRMKSMIQTGVVWALARTAPTQAAALADSGELPALSVGTLLAVADALPDSQRDRKLALLDRAAIRANRAVAQIRLGWIADIAERWYELGEKERARTALTEGLRLAGQPADGRASFQGHFAAQLARFDLPSALAIAKQHPASGMYNANGVLRYIAFSLAADNPAEAERVLRQIPQETGREWLYPMIARKMASIDPSRALRLTEESQRYFDHPQGYLFLANGLKSRDPAAAERAFQAAMRGIDRSMNKGVDYSLMLGARGVLLPLVEQIDPALVPELFWRAVAMRPSIGDPRIVRQDSSSRLVVLLAWYDRDVAAALLEPIRAQMEHTDDISLAGWDVEFLAWSMFDPRAAAARLEKVPVNPKLDLGAETARSQVSELLSLPHEARWRAIWRDFTEMGNFDHPNLWW